jgi:hypothetical protein
MLMIAWESCARIGMARDLPGRSVGQETRRLSASKFGASDASRPEVGSLILLFVGTWRGGSAEFAAHGLCTLDVRGLLSHCAATAHARAYYILVD